MLSISEDAVVWAYRVLLDREPESKRVVEEYRERFDSLRDLRLCIIGSEEYRGSSGQAHARGQSPFFHYATSFDAIETMHRHALPAPAARPGYLVNFLGVAIDPKFFPAILADRAGQVEGVPIPANWHADIAEWATALRAVELSGDRFVMVELGCGWGCWMNNTGVAARATGRQVKVIGIEGDDGHLAFAREALATNGFDDGEIELHRGIASFKSGLALFPRQEVPGASWGSEPIFDAGEEERRRATESGLYDEVAMVPLSQVIGSEPRVDLLHIDIQGGEADLVEQNLALLGDKVAYLLIGTHSKQIEGRLYVALLGAGWRLEMERPALFDIVNGQPRIRVDGVQGWRNSKLLPG